MSKPSKKTIDEVIKFFEYEILEYKKAIIYLKTKYKSYYDKESNL